MKLRVNSSDATSRHPFLGESTWLKSLCPSSIDIIIDIVVVSSNNIKSLDNVIMTTLNYQAMKWKFLSTTADSNQQGGPNIRLHKMRQSNWSSLKVMVLIL